MGWREGVAPWLRLHASSQWDVLGGAASTACCCILLRALHGTSLPHLGVSGLPLIVEPGRGMGVCGSNKQARIPRRPQLP